MNDLRIVNLSTYTSPIITEVKNKDYIQYGEDNMYFQYLIDRYNGSPTNNAIINGISEMIYGKGLDATNSSDKPNEYAQMKVLFKNDCVRKLCYDLKLMGQCAVQIIYSQDRSKVARLEHMPIETLRAEKSEDGEIKAYYYANDWTKVKPNTKLKKIPAFGQSNQSLEIMYIKPYRAGFFYYSPVDYQGGLQYSELEEEVSNYHLNNIMNGLAPSMLINFNNGVPNEEEREMIEQRIYQKFSGSSNAGKFILAFNDNADSQANIDPVQLSDAHNQYQFLSDESTKKIMVSHRVVSPMLLGIKDQSGLGNNADELKTASILMDNTVIRPFQTLLIDHFDKILAYNNISLNLYFKTLQPLEFTELDNVVDDETREEETGVKLTKNYPDQNELSNIADDLINKGEELGEEWQLIDERPAFEDESEIQNYFQFASVVTGDGRKKSDQDTDIFRIRYVYTAGRSTEGESREFCRKMMAANKVYRKEDLDKTSKANVGFSPADAKGEGYNIWLYKGGVNCSHYWMRRIYLKKNNKKITVGRARKIISALPQNEKKGARFEVNPPEVAQIASARNNYWRKN
jgi:plasmid stability protein